MAQNDTPDSITATTPVADAAVTDAPVVEDAPRIHIYEWADALNHAGRMEMLMAYVAREEMTGHVYDTAASFEAGLLALANTRV